MTKVIPNEPTALMVDQISHGSIIGFQHIGTRYKGFLTRARIDVGKVLALAVNNIHHGNNYDVVSGKYDTLNEATKALVNNGNFNVFAFNDEYELFAWLSHSR